MKFRLEHIPQVPMKPFIVPVDSPEEGLRIAKVLWDYDLFQYENRVKGDYCNVTSLTYFDEEENEWLDWTDDDGYYFDDVKDSSD